MYVPEIPASLTESIGHVPDSVGLIAPAAAQYYVPSGVVTLTLLIGIVLLWRIDKEPTVIS